MSRDYLPLGQHMKHSGPNEMFLSRKATLLEEIKHALAVVAVQDVHWSEA